MIRRFLVALVLTGCSAPQGDSSAVKIAPEPFADTALVKAVADLGVSVDAAMVRVQADVTAKLCDLDARIGDVQNSMGSLQTGIGNVQSSIGSIGGGGDSVTAWLYAAIAGSVLIYPLVIRPARYAWHRRKTRHMWLQSALHD